MFLGRAGVPDSLARRLPESSMILDIDVLLGIHLMDLVQLSKSRH